MQNPLKMKGNHLHSSLGIDNKFIQRMLVLCKLPPCLKIHNGIMTIQIELRKNRELMQAMPDLV